MAKSAELRDSKEPIVGGNAHVEQQIEDALRLADFAIESGFKAPDGHAIPSATISTIQETAAKLGFFRGEGLLEMGGAAGSIAAPEWIVFVLAFYQLTALMSPVTARTLTDTEPYESYTSTSPTIWDELSRFFLGSSPANKFTKGLWYVTILFSVIVVGADSTVSLQAEGKISDSLLIAMAKILLPYGYGGLGSCVYLLRSAHTYIYLRTFDVQRKPEYFNRILLGTIAGGTIILFLGAVAGTGPVAKLSSTAVGFLAGYSTDFLFNTIERIIGAVFPKVGGEATRSAPQMTRGTMAAHTDIGRKDLKGRLDKASEQAEDGHNPPAGRVDGSPAPGASSRSRPKGRSRARPNTG
jgi:hypothetical protein